MFSFIRVVVVMVSLHNNKTLRQKLVPETEALMQQDRLWFWLEEYGLWGFGLGQQWIASSTV